MCTHLEGYYLLVSVTIASYLINENKYNKKTQLSTGLGKEFHYFG